MQVRLCSLSYYWISGSLTILGFDGIDYNIQHIFCRMLFLKITSKLIKNWRHLTRTAVVTVPYFLSTINNLPLSAWLWRSTPEPQTTERGSIVLSHHVGTLSSLVARTGWHMSGIQTQVRIMFSVIEKPVGLTVFCIVAAASCFVLSGDQVAVYSELCYPTALHGVSFHPHENMVAFCAFGQSQPVHVYLYDRKGLWKTRDECHFFLRDPAPESLINCAFLPLKYKVS